VAPVCISILLFLGTPKFVGMANCGGCDVRLIAEIIHQFLSL
jgi:hypothetical protein